MAWNGMDYTVRISARALLDLLAGRITHERFCELTGFDPGENLFGKLLARGNTISGMRIDPKGLDNDDDAIVFEFEPDASVLRLSTKNSHTEGSAG